MRKKSFSFDVMFGYFIVFGIIGFLAYYFVG